MKKGDVVLIKFPFTDLSGSKLRPAVVLFDSGNDLIVESLQDKSRSSSVTLGVSGGGVNLGRREEPKKETNTTYSVTGDYGFSDKRQINYATVGEGEIIVRDGTVR